MDFDLRLFDGNGAFVKVEERRSGSLNELGVKSPRVSLKYTS